MKLQITGARIWAAFVFVRVLPFSSEAEAHDRVNRFSLFIAWSLVAALGSGCATTRGPRDLELIPDDVPSPESNWARVAELAPGAAISLTILGSSPIDRRFVAADDAGIAVLNLSDPALPASARRVLRDVAAHHPAYFAGSQQGREFKQDDVRVGRNGVFVANRKIGELGMVLETFRRDDIAEVRGPVVTRGSVAGVVVGGWVGFGIGVVPGLGGVAPEAAWAFLVASTAVGGGLGFRWSTHQTEGLVYRRSH